MATRVWFGLACVAVAAVSATACFVRESDDAETAPQQVTEGRESLVRAVVALEGGCTAVAVGPKQLLVAARCVTNKPAYSIGKPLRFRAANPLVPTTATPDAGVNDAADDANDAARVDASAEGGSDAGAVATSDAGADGGAAGAYEMTIARVEIHPSFLAKCGTGACAAGKTGGNEVADIAVIVLNREIADLTIAPIDLDPTSIGDKLLALGYGCDATADDSDRISGKATSAVTPDQVNHAGSPYDARPDLARELAKSYVVTRGPGSAASAGAPGICSERDLGAPLFRSDGSAIVGVSSGTTLALNALPMTNEYARVDGLSRHNVGAWLAKLGVKTTRTCSAPGAAGCPKQPETPADDAGDASAATPPADDGLLPGSGEGAPTEEGASTNGRSPSGEDEGDAPKKKSSDNAGCSAAPIAPSSTSLGLAGYAAAAVALTMRARRRRA